MGGRRSLHPVPLPGSAPRKLLFACDNQNFLLRPLQSQVRLTSVYYYVSVLRLKHL